MRLMLVRAPARHTVESEVPPAVEAENQSYPPLALLSLASYIKECTSHQVAILDAQLHNYSYEELEQKIDEWKPDVVGITVYTVGLVDCHRTIQIARKLDCVKHIVLGGPHINDFPKESVGLAGVDAVVKGEGQKPLELLLDCWERGEEPKGIPGVVAHVDDVVPSEDTYFSNDLDDYPLLDLELIDFEQYYDVMGQGGTFTTMVTSRGCPYRCTFCNTPRHRYRVMSPSRACDQIQMALDRGITELYFVDDTFNITNKRVHELCDEIIRRGLVFSWTVRFRVKGVDRELLENMKAAGCHRIQFGVEQGTEEGLLILKKDVNVREIETAFALCRDVGINTVAYFMIGTPVERNRDDIMETIRYSIKLDPDFVMYNILTPFPGTVLYDQGMEAGVLDVKPWMRFMANPDENFKAQVWEEHFTREELRDYLDLAYRSFYWRPRFMARNLTQIRSPKDFFRKASAGVRLLTG
ncbi:MAG: anaerobic magnesium-protoporphyrin IX monomethyl ester cyclase [Cognaticolwellia sp.]|jgi:anaerobic magnesium-protoporphyrin IX monomethyl ester cyclase